MGIWICKLILWVLVFFTGSCIFSFLNVIVYRVPRHESFVKGFSRCPACGERLTGKDLVPVISYIVLGGKCRYCKASIGVRDTLIEVMGGMAALVCVYAFDPYSRAITVFLFFCILTVVTLLDIDTMEIEDGCWIAIAVLSVAAIFTMPDITIAQRLIGLVCVSVPLLLITIAIPGAFGGGDIKLMAACGLFLGWKLTLISAAMAIFLGGGYGIYLLATGKKERKEHFAFGPFLCAGMAIGIFFGQQIIDWYFGSLLF